MTFGEPDAGTHPWTLGEDASRPIIRHAVEQGINFFDTANSYSAALRKASSANCLRSSPAAKKP